MRNLIFCPLKNFCSKCWENVAIDSMMFPCRINFRQTYLNNNYSRARFISMSISIIDLKYTSKTLNVTPDILDAVPVKNFSITWFSKTNCNELQTF